MNRVRVAAVVLALATATSASATALFRQGPDEWLSRHIGEGDVIRPTISDDGRYVAVEANHPDYDFARVALVLDRQNLAVPERIGTDCPLGAGLCEQYRPRLSGNGRFVIFDARQWYTSDGDQFQGDSDVFVWDRVTQTTSRVSLGMNNTEPNDESFAGDISRNGRYVVFNSYATNLAAYGIPSQRTLRSYWMDRQTGVVKLVYEGGNSYQQSYPYVRLTANGRYAMAIRGGDPDGTVINWDALNGTLGYAFRDYWLNEATFAMTNDRRYVAFTTVANAQVLRIDAQPAYELATGNGLYYGGVDLSAGANWLGAHSYPDQLNQLAHVVSFYGRTTTDRQHTALYDNHVPYSGFFGFDMSADGRYAVFVAYDQQVVGVDPWDADNDQDFDVFLVENRLWKPSPTNLVQQFTSVPADSRNVKVSSDGRIGVFESEIPASEFGAYTDSNGAPDVFRYLADFQQIELLSTADGTAAFPAGARNPAMSGDGEVVAFEALDAGIAAVNVGADEKAAAPVAYKASTISIFLRRLVQNQLQRASSSRTGGAANGNSMNPSVSSNGRRVAFATDADNVNPGSDTNAARDVVAVDLETGSKQCVSSCAVPANGASDRPAVSDSGHVAFESSAPSVQKAAGADKATSFAQIVLRSLVTGSSQIVSRNSAGQSGNAPSTRPSISNNGAVVAYQSSASNLDASGSDGRINVIRTLIGAGSQRISRSGGPNGKSAKVADGDSVQPALSGDGRFLAFQTDATTLAGSDGNGVTDLMVYDARAGVLQRLAEGYGGLEPNGASETPHLNRNGTRVGFHSYASNFDSAESDAASTTSAPYEAVNPLAASIVFADAFE